MYEQTLQNISDQITKLEETREFIKLMPELALPTGYYWITGNVGYVGVNLPYDHELINRNGQIMVEAGFNLVHQFQSTDDGVLHLSFRQGDWTNKTIDFFYRPALTGSTCKLNLLGYEQKPIYEVTCLEA